jgi:hypothetical protein
MSAVGLPVESGTASAIGRGVTFIAIGLALGFLVSVPPGPNSAVCVSLASGGARRALPLITGAAVTDAAYSILAASGALLLARSGIAALEFVVPAFMLGTAVICWSPDSAPGKGAAFVPILNPATTAIWLGLSSLPWIRAMSLPEAMLRSVPVAIGTAIWFGLLAVATSRIGVQIRPGGVSSLQKFVAGALAVGALFDLVMLLH